MKSIKLLLIMCMSSMTMFVHSKEELERTFAMIKPHAVAQNKADEIIAMIKDQGFEIIAMKMIQLTAADAQKLYQQYRWRSWFKQYVSKMSKSPAVVMVLERQDAVAQWDAYKKVIRSYFSAEIRNNVVHGSDTVKDAKREMAIFFKDLPK